MVQAMAALSRLLAWLTMPVWLAGAAAVAAPAPTPPPASGLSVPPVTEAATAVEPAANRESERETIAKALADCSSPDADKRMRAVLILGKYRDLQAQKAVLTALCDKVAAIRRSALVALVEPPINPAVQLPVLRCIGDPDVHVRRIASSSISQVMSPYQMIFRGGLDGNTVLSRPNVSLDPATAAVVRRAFSDEDETVRKNMISAYSYFRDLITPDMVEALLRDTSREVRILALSAIRSMLPISEVLERTRFLADDPDPHIRRRLAAQLGYANISGVNDVLHQLAEDKDFAVSTEALLSLLKNHEASVFPELRRRLDSPELERSTALQIIRYASLLPDDAEEALRKLMHHPNPEYRLAAVQAYGNRFWKTADPKIFLELLDDDSAQVRAVAGMIFLRAPEVSPDVLRQMTANRHDDVRLMAVRLTRRMPAADAGNMLTELLLDEDVEVRLQSVAEICNRQLDGWKDILRATLEDEEPVVQLRAARQLLALPQPAVRLELRRIGASSTNPTLRQLLLQGPSSPIQRFRSPVRVPTTPTTPRPAPIRRVTPAPRPTPPNPGLAPQP